jgi:hypothetical protein
MDFDIWKNNGGHMGTPRSDKAGKKRDPNLQFNRLCPGAFNSDFLAHFYCASKLQKNLRTRDFYVPF